MKMGKRFFAGLLTAAMMGTLFSGCGEQPEPAADSGAQTDSGQPAAANVTDGEMKIGLIMSSRDEFLSSMETGMQNAIPEGVQFNTQDAQNDSSKQLQMIEAYGSAGYHAVVVCMVDSESAADYKQAAGDMKIVFVNRVPTDLSLLDENCVYVGSDETTAGKLQGEWLANYFKEKGQTDVKYVLMQGILGHISTSLRSEGVVQALKDAGLNPIEATSPLACDYDRAKAIDKFSPLIGKLEYDCVISNNDAMAIGVIEALRAKNLDPAEKPIAGIDATRDGRDEIKNGALAMSVFQDPDGQGRAAIMAAYNLVKGNDFAQDTGYEKDAETGRILWVPFEAVTADNVAQYDNR